MQIAENALVSMSVQNLLSSRADTAINRLRSGMVKRALESV